MTGGGPTEADLMRLAAVLRRNCDWCEKAPAADLCAVHRVWYRDRRTLEGLVALRDRCGPIREEE